MSVRFVLWPLSRENTCSFGSSPPGAGLCILYKVYYNSMNCLYMVSCPLYFIMLTTLGWPSRLIVMSWMCCEAEHLKMVDVLCLLTFVHGMGYLIHYCVASGELSTIGCFPELFYLFLSFCCLWGCSGKLLNHFFYLGL